MLKDVKSKLKDKIDCLRYPDIYNTAYLAEIVLLPLELEQVAAYRRWLQLPVAFLRVGELPNSVLVGGQFAIYLSYSFPMYCRSGLVEEEATEEEEEEEESEQEGGSQSIDF